MTTSKKIRSGARPSAQMRQLKQELEDVRSGLMLIDPDKLGDADRLALSEQIFQLSLAINALRNAALESLSEAFKAELPSFESAAARLRDDLSGLQESVDVIRAVAGGFGIFGNIAKLLA
jgi:hypothetical protein